MDAGGGPGREPLGRLHPPKAVIVASAYALAVGELIHRTLSWRGSTRPSRTPPPGDGDAGDGQREPPRLGDRGGRPRGPLRYSAALLGLGGGEAGVLAAAMLILLPAGMFTDAITIMVITVPILLPVAREMSGSRFGSACS